MDSKKITNWLNWNEWKSVVDDAYNFDDREVMQRAFNRILAWESRDSTLPAAISCLKELLIAKLRHIDIESASIDEIYGYQSLLSLNIVRFVNFITEPYQTHIYAKPIKTIANEIGLPDWIVNLRHNATHYSLPSLELLENAREYLLVWLKQNYIDSYKEIGFEPKVLENMKVYFHDLFVKYVNISYKKFLTKKNKQEATLDLQYEQLEQEIRDLTWHFRNEAFDIVLGDGFLVPTKDEMNAMGLIAEEYLEQNNLDLPKLLLRIWTPYLTYCNDANLTSLLFQKLVSSYKLDFEAHKLLEHNQSSFPSNNGSSGSNQTSRGLRGHFLLAWIMYFLRSNSYKLPEKQKNAKFFFEFNVKETFLTLFESISPNMGLLLINELNRIPIFMKEIGQAKLDKISQLVMIMNQSSYGEANSSNHDMSTDSIDYTDQDNYFNDLISKHSRPNASSDGREFTLRSKLIRSHLSNNSDWKPIEDPSWNSDNAKLGLLESQTYSSLNLDLRQFMAPEGDKTPDSPSFNASMNMSMNVSSQRHMLNSATKLSTSLRSVENETHLFDGNKKPSNQFVDKFKRSLINNYWEN